MTRKSQHLSVCFGAGRREEAWQRESERAAGWGRQLSEKWAKIYFENKRHT